MNETKRIDIDGSVFHHILMGGNNAAKIIFETLRADDMCQHDTADAFSKLQTAYTNGADLSSEQRCVDLASKYAAYADIALMDVLSDSIDAVMLQSSRRRLSALCTKTMHLINDPAVGVNALNAAAREFAETAADDRTAHKTDSSPRAALKASAERMARIRSGAINPIRTGYADIDAHVDLAPGTLHAIVAEPAVGKSALALNWFNNQLCMDGVSPAYMSLEMEKDECVDRLISMRSTVPYECIRRVEMANSQWADYSREAQSLEQLQWRLYRPVDAVTPAEIGEIVREWVERQGINIVYIDQLSTIRHDKAFALKDQFAATYKTLGQICRRFRIPIVVLAQQRRDTEKRKQSIPPQLSDIKECSNINEDSHTVTMLFRPDYDGQQENLDYGGIDMRGKAMAYVRKNRGGKPCSQRLMYNGETYRFRAPMAAEWQ